MARAVRTAAGAAGTATRRIVAAALAAAAAVHLAFRVRQLVSQAALQPPAKSRELRGVQTQILLLGHLDRDGLERLKKRRAAERTAAGAIAAVHLGFVADADLAHLDPHAEFARQLPHKVAEVDPSVRGEIEQEPRSVERVLDARELHREAALADFQQRDAVRFLFAPLLLQPRDDVVAAGQSDDAMWRVRRGPTLLVELRDAAHDRADCRAGVGLHDNAIARMRLPVSAGLCGVKRMGPADGRQLHGHEGRRRRHAHSCKATQSATTFTPALLLSASRPRSMAKKASTPRWPRKARVNRSSVDLASGCASRRSSASVATTSTSLSSTAMARRCEESCSRSSAPPRPVLTSRSFAASSLRPASPPAAARASTRSATSRALGSISAGPLSAKFSRIRRERTVGSSTSGCEVTRMNTEEGGGSSSVFSSAFCAAGTSAAASSMMTVRRRPSNGR